MNRPNAFWYLTALLLWCGTVSRALPPQEHSAAVFSARSIDNTTYIHANKILMFVTNHGNFGRDLAAVFGHDFGTFFPCTNVDDITSGFRFSSPLYAGGLWVGGIDSATGDTLVTVSEYSSEYVPGPMAGGTFQPDRPGFRVYKLYRDSLADNPNADYLEWPVDQGAPVDGFGNPLLMGDQLTWAVCNDADPDQHTNNNGETDPIGIEVQQTIWAVDQDGDHEIPIGADYEVVGPEHSPLVVTATCIYPEQVTGHEYTLVVDSTDEGGFCWHLIDVSMDDTVLACQSDFTGEPVEVAGFALTVQLTTAFESFECIANGAGPLDPIEGAAASWQGFPCPTGASYDGRPTDNQQVGGGRWLIHTGDNGGTGGGGTRYDYLTFLSRTLRTLDDGGARLARLGAYDWEMRFTGSYDNPGVGGGYAWASSAFGQSGEGLWVPFELWRTGVNTPDDPSDDLRIIPWILEDVNNDGTGSNLVFDVSQYGSQAGGSCHEGCEHSVSGGDDDPYTDWIYWRLPDDQTPGDAGYQAFETAMMTDPQSWPGTEVPVMDRMVLVNWNGGVTPPFTQDLPEQGTIFRIRPAALTVGLAFSFTAQPPTVVSSGPLGLSLFLRHSLINRGSRTMKDFFFSLWLDPDLGSSGDDLVGCDTANDLLYCYNGNERDGVYLGAPPAIGFRLLEGPAVYSPGDTAIVDGLRRPDFRNLGMYSFNKYINGTDPDGYAESYCYMKGLDAKSECTPHRDPTTLQTTRFVCAGNPISGTGWIDEDPADRRMMASFGPFTLRPGDTQQVLFKMAVAQGTSRLNSISELREVLLWDNTPTGTGDDTPPVLPTEFRVTQNYPNPFNASTVISYTLPERADVEIVIFNVLGQRVALLERNTVPAGEHSVVWTGTDANGRPVASGVYFYRVKAGENSATRKMLLLK